MPSGATHRTATLALAPWIASGAWLVTADPLLATCAAGGCLVGLRITPDLDQDKHAPILWRPYARAFVHRSVSHWPIVGTLSRLAYLWLIGQVATAAVCLAAGWPVLWLVPVGYEAPLAFGAMGLMAADTLHGLMDGLSSWLQKLL